MNNKIKMPKRVITALQSIRGMLVSFLKIKNLNIPTDIRVSSAGKDGSYGLVVEATGLNHLNLKNLTADLRKYFEDMDEPIDIVVATSSKLELDFSYLEGKFKDDTEMVEVLEAEENIEKKEITKETHRKVGPVNMHKSHAPVSVSGNANSPPKNLTNFDSIPDETEDRNKSKNFNNFQDLANHTWSLSKIMDVLEPEIPKSVTYQPFVLKNKEGRNKTAELQNVGKFDKHTIFYLLEKADYFVSWVNDVFTISTQAPYIEGLPPYQKYGRMIQNCKEFIASMEKWMKKNNIRGTVKTHPFFIVTSGFKERLEVKCPIRKDALKLEKLLEANGLTLDEYENEVLSASFNQNVLAKIFMEVYLNEKDFDEDARVSSTPVAVPKPVSERVEVSPQLVKDQSMESNGDTTKSRKGKTSILGEVREVLENIIPSERLSKSYFLKRKHDQDDAVELIEDNKFLRTQAMFALEKAGFTVIVSKSVITMSKDASYIKGLKDYKRNSTKIETAQIFLKNFKAWMKKNEILDARINTHPIHIANSIFSESLEVYCSDINNIIKIQRLCLALNLKARAIENMMYINLISTPRGSFTDIDIDTDGLPVQVREKGLETYIDKNGSIRTDFESDNPLEFNFFFFNRIIDWDHVDNVGHSVDRFGTLEKVKAIYTDLIDGTKKLWILDGQHTFWSLVMRGKKIEYVIIKVSSKRDIIELIATLNNERKPWSNLNYLDAWLEINDPVYNLLGVWVKERKFPLYLALCIITGKSSKTAMKDFRDGRLRPEENVDYEHMLEILDQIKELFPKKAMIMETLARFMKKHKDFDILAFKNAINEIGPSFKTSFGTEDTPEIVMSKLTELYPVKLLENSEVA